MKREKKDEPIETKFGMIHSLYKGNFHVAMGELEVRGWRPGNLPTGGDVVHSL